MQHSEDPAVLSSSPAEESDNPLSAAPVDPLEPQSLPGLDGTPVRCESLSLSLCAIFASWRPPPVSHHRE